MLNIIVAPRNYNPKAEKFTKRIVKYLKNQQVEYSVYFSSSVDDIKTSVKQLVSLGESTYVVVGDDAVIHSVLACFKDLNKIKLGIVPISKRDDFACCLNLSFNPIQAIKDILQNNLKKVDLMLANDMVVVNNIAIGASVEVFHVYSQYKIKNFISEKVATAKYGKNFPGVELSLDVKGKNKKLNVFDLVIANGVSSHGKPVSPLSNVNDGLFNLTYTLVSNNESNKKVIKMYNKGEHIYQEETKQFWLNTLKITSSDKKIKALIDGKVYNLEELNVSVLEGALKIYQKP